MSKTKTSKPTANKQSAKQMTFAIKTRGGLRHGAGRKKRLFGEPTHQAREQVTSRTPVHVTLKLQKRLFGKQDRLRGGEFSSLRHRDYLVMFADAVRGAGKSGLRVQQYSIQQNHIHLIAEADTAQSFAKGMQSLTISFAKRLRNRLQLSNGKVFLGRYHAHVLKTPTEVKNALLYVLQNTARHWEKARPGVTGKIRSHKIANNTSIDETGKTAVIIQDPFSSVQSFANPEKLFGVMASRREAKKYFAGVKHVTQAAAGEFLSAPKSWLLSIGWTRGR